MKIQTKLNKVQASQVQELINYTGLDLNTIVRIALMEYYQRQRQVMHNAGYDLAFQCNTSNIPAKPLESLEVLPPMDNTIPKHSTKLLWPEWSTLNPGKSNDEFMQYFMKDA